MYFTLTGQASRIKQIFGVAYRKWVIQYRIALFNKWTKSAHTHTESKKVRAWEWEDKETKPKKPRGKTHHSFSCFKRKTSMFLCLWCGKSTRLKAHTTVHKYLYHNECTHFYSKCGVLKSIFFDATRNETEWNEWERRSSRRKINKTRVPHTSSLSANVCTGPSRGREQKTMCFFKATTRDENTSLRKQVFSEVFHIMRSNKYS